MPASNDRKTLLALFDRFANAEIGGRAFVRRFLRLWRKRPDALLARTPGRAAEWLQAGLIAKKMTSEDVSRRRDALWGYRSENDVAFDERIDRIFTVCDAFSEGAPDPKGEEDRLRSFVAETVGSYDLVIARR